MRNNKELGREKTSRIPIKIVPIEPLKKPSWIKMKLPKTAEYMRVKNLLSEQELHSVCEEASCPNIAECYSHGTATFMILGDLCTRRCPFCDVTHGKPKPPDDLEPLHLAKTISSLKLKYVVITSVDRDDLRDGGASVWAETINEIRKENPTTTMETLIPDFKGKKEDIQKIIDAAPEVVSHNMETVKRLTKKVRIQAKYDRSLQTLKYLVDAGMKAKSGIMLGLGETEVEVIETMHDLKDIGVQIITIGQYLQPTKKHLPVIEYITPEQFKKYKDLGSSLGFKHVESGPLVRSSYHAERHIS